MDKLLDQVQNRSEFNIRLKYLTKSGNATKSNKIPIEFLIKDGEKYVGLSVMTTFDIKSDLNIEIDSKSSESGPSGGMMMALMIYDGLTGKDLTRGRKIVGTGTISKNGEVGDIGGVKFKLMGAAKAKADVFLVPEGNYEEAMKVAKEKKYKIEIVKVTTLQDAIDYLEGE